MLNARSALFARCGKFMASLDEATDTTLMAFFAKTEADYAKDLKAADALAAPRGNALYNAPVQQSFSALGGSDSTHQAI